MLPLGMLNAARRQAVLVEAKSGETYNGTLLACDVWMNVRLGDAVRTDAAGVRCHALREVLLRGSAIKCIRMPEAVVDAAHDYNRRQQAQRRARAAAEGRTNGPSGPSNAVGDRPSSRGNVQFKTSSGPLGNARGDSGQQSTRGGSSHHGSRGSGRSHNGTRGGGQQGPRNYRGPRNAEHTGQKDSDRAANA